MTSLSERERAAWALLDDARDWLDFKDAASASYRIGQAQRLLDQADALFAEHARIERRNAQMRDGLLEVTGA